MLSPHRLFLHLSVLVCMALLFFCPEAFARTEVRGQISTDTTWTVAGSPYIITGTVVVRGKDGDDGVTTLTIEPGVELRFNANTRLDVGGSSGDPGALIAAGTADAPIRFTANSADPKPGHWNGIRFLATAQSTSRMEHSIISYAGRSNTPAVRIIGAAPVLSSCHFTHNQGYDIRYSGNVGGALYNSYLRKGLDFTGTGVVAFDNNTLHWDNAFPVKLPADNVDTFVASTEFKNLDGESLLQVTGTRLQKSSTWKASIPYGILSDLSVYGRDGENGVTTLTLAPGVELRFNANTRLDIGRSSGDPGALIAAGTADAPVRFTANSEDPKPGHWNGIRFLATAQSTSRMEHSIISYAGRSNTPAVRIIGAAPVLSSCHFTHNQGYDIRYSGNVGGALYNSYLRKGLDFTGTGVVAFDNNIIYWDNAFPVKLPADNVDTFVASTEFKNLDGESLLQVTGTRLQKSSTWKASIPYGILSDLSVYGRDGENGVTTLTLAPGVELRFNSNTRLDIGRSSGDPGALIARGRTDAPIRFTADSTGPQPGHWQGIAFNATSHESSLIEHGIVEYGGRNNRGNILIHSSSPAIRFSTIRNSVFNGISLSGAKSSDAVIACNTFRENRVGIYAQSAARPEISANNFINNFDFGLHNATGQILVAEGNWWGHVEGPDQGGDRVSGNVAFSPWLGSPADCTPPIADNEPPFVPHDPFPAHGAENLRFPDKRITLSWKGGDPNPSDTLTYTLFLGRDADSLNLVAEDLEQTSWSLSVEPDTTYFWRVKARDSHGAETSGPVWRFTTSGPQADLVVSHLAWDPPSGMEAGQVVNFTATIKNQGAGPASVFNVGFFVNGRRISLPRLQGLAAGASAQVSATWTAQKGPAEIEVKSDVHNHVPEDDESNNNYLVSLGEIPDTTPPEMTSSNPAHGAIIHEVSRIDIYLTDRHGGSVDNAATLETLSLTREGLVIPGTRGVSANRFYFTPSSLPLEPGLYLMTFTAFDTAGNSKAYEIAFTIKTDKPAPPVITGSEVYSGPIQPRPADNRSNTTYITLTGEREENTGIRILRNNSTGYVSQVASGSDTWSSSIYLYQGNNVLEVRAQSPAGVLSDPVWVDIFLDSLPPGVSRVHPPNNSFLDTPPQVCELSVHEQGSGFDSETSTLKLLDQNNGLVDGSADWIGKENLFRFTPSAPLSDGTYALEAYLVDRMGNASIHKYTFTVDTQAPPPPLIYEVSSPTHAVTQLLRGEKEAFAALYMNGEELTRYTAATGWEHRVRLEPGENIFIFTAKDRAGNVSEESRVRIVWDDIPPLPVNNLSASGEGNGTTVFLNWAGYDEALHGDIEKYLIFYETEPFTSISGLSPRGEVPAGIFTHAVQNLIHGTPYWFAVVAVDEAGQFRSGVSPVAARPLNANAPREVNNLAVYSHADRLVFTWEAPADQQGDFMGYKINFDRAQPPELLGPDALLWEKSGLAPASAHTFKIQGYNSRGIESFGLSEKACTWLLNPSAIRFEVLPEGARLSWDSSEPSECLRHYALYLSSEGPFDSTEGMAPFSEVKENKALLSGLANHETVHVALVAVNISGGHNPYVQSLALTPRPDETGPVISDVKFGSDLLEEGDALSRSGLLSLKAEDVSGVSRVAFYLNGVLRHTAFGAPYGWQVDIHGLEEGSHVLKIVAWDSFGNSTSLVKNIRVELALPAAPVFTKPANGWITHAPLVLFGGRSEPDTRVQLYLGETPFGDLLDVDRRGAFSAGLTLTPGVHLVRAAALNAAGRGPLSAALQVEVDTSLPSAPVNLKAEALEAGVMRLSWSAGPGDPPSGFNLYRSATPFTELAQAQKVNTKIIGGLGHRDMPAQDGAWFYRVTALNKAGNESAPSEPASGISDSKGPRARVSYAPEGPVHPHTQAMGQGRVGVRVEVNEPLMAPPFFSITPEGGHPLPVDLTKTGELLYEGYFDIEGSTPSGRAWAVFSARDLAGNRGTEIDEGPSFDIDAKGPSLIKLDLNPQSPIHNNESPLGVRFRAALDRKTTEGVLPDFAFVLSGAGRQPEAISSIVKGTAAPDEAEVWEGAFDLPLDAGFDGPELLSFTFSSTCLLGNEGRRITAPNRFQVYAGDLPPLSPPSGLGAKALPAGAVALSWHAVEHSSGYRIYRQDGENGDFHLLTELDSGDAEAFEDRVTHDGLYVYAITSLRKENGEVAESVFSASASVKALVTLPPAPKNLRLRLIPPGIEASWEGPGEGRDYTHRLYRSDAGEIHSVDGLTPLEARFNGNKALDSRPSPTEHAYVLTRVDPAGNESLPSNSVYLNVHLLPADHFLVSRRQGKNPELSWTHPGGSRLEGFLLSMGAPGSLVSVTESPIRVYGMEDTGFGGEERAYRLVAVDSHGEPSPARELLLPHLSISLAEGPPLRRGVMNHLFFDVKNHGNTDLEGLRVSLRLHDRDHGSEPFGLKAGEGQRVAVVVPGYGALKDREPLSFYVEQSPEPGLRARIGAEGEVLVQEGMLALTLRSEEMIRGGAGLVSFVLENTGEGEIELVTAKNFGNRPSEDIRFSLLDGDGNLLASIPFMQFTGEAVQTLANGTSLVRLGPGAVFTSAAVEIPVPGAAPERAVLKLEFDRIYHGFQSKDPLVLRGFAGTREVGLKETDYAAEILEASPSVAYGQDVRIRGRVFVKEDGKSLPHAPFNLVLMQNGFERKIALVSGSDGEFSYTFRPTAKESGVYQVAALHPDILDRPVQAEFTIARVGLHPSRIRLSLPKNYEKTLPISLEVAEGLVVNNLRLVKEDWDQPANAFEEGVFWDAGPAITRLEGGKKAGIPLKIHSDNRAADHGSLVLRLVSDEVTGLQPLGFVHLDISFTEAKPHLFYPNYKETGLVPGESLSEVLTFKNQGLADVEGLTFSLKAEGGKPLPDWVLLNRSKTPSVLGVGESLELPLTLAPPLRANEGLYSFIVAVDADNHESLEIPVFVTLTTRGRGHALFKVKNIYTGSLSADGRPIQGLGEASITLQNEKNLNIHFEKKSDDLGEALFTDLPAGSYKYRVRAPGHQEKTGRLWIRAGVTASEALFLEYNFVTVEWRVQETTIEDRYDIVLTLTYETDVPAPVVICDPTSVSLPDLKAGDVMTGEISCINHGLIRADNLRMNLPEDDAFIRYQLLAEPPESLGAKERISIPYRLVALRSLNTADEVESGGSGGGYGACGYTHYSGVAANGCPYSGSSPHCFSRPVRGSGSGGTSSGGGGGWWWGGGTGGSSSGPGGGSWTGSGTSIATQEGVCVPLPGGGGPGGGGPGGGGPGGGGPGGGGPGGGGPGGGCGDESSGSKGTAEPECGDCERMEADICGGYRCVPVGSSILPFTGEFVDGDTDLWVRAQGGRLGLVRNYSYGSWDFNIHSRIWPVFEGSEAEDTKDPARLFFNGYAYEKSGSATYTRGNYRILIHERDSSGRPSAYRYESSSGAWELFEKPLSDKSFGLSSWGNIHGVTARLVYNGEGQPSTLQDRHGEAMLFFTHDAAGRLTQAKDGADRRVNYVWSGELLTEVKDPMGESTLYAYDGWGRIHKITDPSGHTRTMAYDNNGRVHSVLDEKNQGHTFAYSYDALRQEYYSRTEDPDGSIREIWYDRNGRIKKTAVNGEEEKRYVRDGRVTTEIKGGARTKKEFDVRGNLIRITHPDGTEESFAYDPLVQKKTLHINGAGTRTRFVYDARGRLLARIEAEGLEEERRKDFSYDEEGNLIEVKESGGDGSRILAMAYDSRGNLILIKDAEGHEEHFTHDTMGNVLTRKDGLGRITRFDYDAKGRMVRMEDAAGLVTLYAYDAKDRRIREQSPSGLVTTFTYDDQDNLIHMERTAPGLDPEQSRFTYTPSGSILTQEDEEGAVIRYDYDARGRLASTLDGRGNEILKFYGSGSDGSCGSCSLTGRDLVSRIEYPTFIREFRYDIRGRKTSERDILSDTEALYTAYAYDATGKLTKITDAEGRSTHYHYDALGRLLRVEDAAGGITSYAYDARGNLLSLNDAKGQTTRFVYDLNNRLVEEIRPGGQKLRYAYDAAGGLVERIDPKNQRTRYDYDDAGRLEKIHYFGENAGPSPVKTVTFSYDGSGRLAGYDDGESSATYTYDAAGRKLEEALSLPGFTVNQAYTYYKNGLKQSYTGPDGVTQGYLYDQTNQLAGVVIPGAGMFTVNDFTWNRPSRASVPGGTVKTQSYDPLMRLEAMEVKDPAGNTRLERSYGFDRVGNVKEKHTEHGDYAYTYDDLYRLTEALNPRPVKEEAFEYDAVGNRKRSSATDGEWRYDANNALTGFDDVSYEYDANGNMVRKLAAGLVTSYVYNLEDRLSEVWAGEPETGRQIASYGYDPFGRRLWKEVDGKKTWFVYSDEGLVAELDALGREIRSFGWKPQGIWGTDPLYLKEAGHYYWYHNDHLGTPQMLTASSGAVVWEAKYESFGRAMVDGGARVKNPLRFPGQYEDEETGLHYNWWRYYDPEVGRYLRVDPIGLEGGINLFRFVENNPINNIDFNGLSCIKLFSFTVPSGISKDFRLKHLGDWEFIAPPQAQLSISPGKILGKYGPVISNTTTGLALCNAKRKRIYEGTYKLFGTRIEGGVCYDKCYRVTRWSREEQVILGEGHLRDRIEYDGASKAIKIVAPVAFLANLVCAQWLMTLR